MKVVKKSANGIEYLAALLKDKKSVFTRAIFWRIPHASGKEEIHLKVGRYKKEDGWLETLISTAPKSALTLDDDELRALLTFLSENYAPLADGAKKYIPLDDAFDKEKVEHIRAVFDNPDKMTLLKFITDNNLLPQDLLVDLEHKKRVDAIGEFETMLSQDLLEDKWQAWFAKNEWVLGTEFVQIIGERDIDTEHITDYLMQAYDGFVDIVEIKRPDGGLHFWANTQDHGNHVPSSDLIKAITQATRYIFEVEREANSVKFLERTGNVKTVKPRCVLVFGRSQNWNDEQKESYRILNASYHNLTVMTYDHVLARARRIVGITEQVVENHSNHDPDGSFDVEDVPF